MKNNRRSAGLIMYRYRDSKLEVLLVHPGGPYWAGRDEGTWSIPKGEYSNEEDPLAAAKREFKEETGFDAEGDFLVLTPRKQPSGKLVSAWAFEGDCDVNTLKSNTFSMEWPPHSGKQSEFPEVDRAEWFPVSAAKKKLLKGQTGFIDELCERLEREGKI
jgi:predicted NUDIX family NTP pyrophosphohydrolase